MSKREEAQKRWFKLKQGPLCSICHAHELVTPAEKHAGWCDSCDQDMLDNLQSMYEKENEVEIAALQRLERSLQMAKRLKGKGDKSALEVKLSEVSSNLTPGGTASNTLTVKYIESPDFTGYAIVSLSEIDYDDVDHPF